ncbi:MAG: hypothetical protein HRU19_23530 [Pseudobacteriovorax sp.]|nr:hypothetical protein [Pseudobacteriovorax sp.]
MINLLYKLIIAQVLLLASSAKAEDFSNTRFGIGIQSYSGLFPNPTLAIGQRISENLEVDAAISYLLVAGTMDVGLKAYLQSNADQTPYLMIRGGQALIFLKAIPMFQHTLDLVSSVETIVI